LERTPSNSIGIGIHGERSTAGWTKYYAASWTRVNATILHLIGLDHMRLTFLYQGRDMRLTDVHGENEFTKLLVA